ncbi:MAG TPA: DUF6799 domain-containing protein [Flavisolibacter sp.]
MKKTFFLAGATALLFACNSETKDTTGTNTTAPTTTTNTSDNAANATSAYSPTEGDVTYRDGRVQVWRNNNWAASDNDVTLDDGTVVRRNGRAVRNNEEVTLEDGTVVNKSGRFFDKAGNAVEDGWEGLKKGAKKAKEGIEKGAGEVKEEVKDAVNKDEKRNN